MPLTPADVAHRTFRQQAYRGYLIADVDAFCDEVESELGRLLRDNEQLRQSSPAGGGPAAVAAPPPGGVIAAPGSTGAVGVAQDAVPQAALRTLQMAQRTADDAIAQAQAEAESILAAARAEADSTLASARAEADSTLASARAEAAAAERTSAALVAQTVGDLEWRRDELQERIDELRAFEREYRWRLTAYLQAQVRELTSRAAPDDNGAGLAPSRPAVDWSPPQRHAARPPAVTAVHVNRHDAPATPAIAHS